MTTKEDLLSLWETLFPSSYVRSIKDGAGDDVVHSSAEIFARASSATCANQQRLFIKPHSKQVSDPASAGEFARGSVEITRADTSQTITISAGESMRFVLPSSTGGEWWYGMKFHLVSDVVFLAGEDTKNAAIIASNIGEEGNFDLRPGEFDPSGRRDFSSAIVDASGINIDLSSSPDRPSTSNILRNVVILDGANAGEFRRIVSVSGTTITIDSAINIATTEIALFEWEDVGVTISSIGPTVGGLDAWLDEHGEERCVRRQALEADPAYRARMCALADTVSPSAIRRTISRVLSPLGIGWSYKDNAIGLALDVMAWDGDDRSWLLLDSTRQVRYFVVCVGLSNAGDIGFPYDDVGPFPTAFFENAWDEGFLDGRAFEWESAISALYAELLSTKGAGIAFDIILDPTL